MGIGVAFFSYIMGNFTSLIASSSNADGAISKKDLKNDL
jgi:hypothetical protein